MKERETLESCLGIEKEMKRQVRKKRHQNEAENQQMKKERKKGTTKT